MIEKPSGAKDQFEAVPNIRRVLVIGAGGQLATAFEYGLQGVADVIAITIHECDIRDSAAVHEVIARHRPDLVLNCAAFNDVDGAESQPLEALQVNGLAPLALARATAALGATFVHYSTDFVFDGETSKPYEETDRPNPRSVYGLSKLTGELLVSSEPGRNYVLRLESLYGGPRSRSTTDNIIAAIERGDEVRVFVDRTVTFSYVPDVMDATWRLAATGSAPGLYHVVNSGVTTWDEMAREAARLLGREAKLVLMRTADVALRAARPQYCALSNAKLRSAGIPMPDWQHALRRHLTR